MNSATSTGSKFDERLLELSSQIDAFECYDHSHGLRVAEIANALAERLRFSEHDRSLLLQASLLHDIGEFAMGRDYIAADRNLNETERYDLHRHPVIGEQEAAKRGLSKGVQLIIRWHHESWNGSGYPDALCKDDIPIASRVLRVADAYAAMTADRPYRGALSDTQARRVLVEFSAIGFDPVIVKAFIDDVAVV